MPPDNADEIRFWNRRGGSQWRDHQALFDTLFADVTTRLMHLAAVRPGETVMDVGCGNGDTTAQWAAAVGATGRVTGVDVSVPLLDAARRRMADLGHVRCLEADAQKMSLESRFDVVASRFGVMFFADPVAAFTNLRHHTRDGGRLAMASWGELEDNPWFCWPFEVATTVLGAVPERDPRRPGPTAFGDPAYVRDILTRAGWHDVAVRSEAVRLHVEGDAQRTAELAADLGPVSRVYKAYPPTPEDKADVVARLSTRYRAGESNGRTTVPAHIHFFTARNST